MKRFLNSYPNLLTDVQNELARRDAIRFVEQQEFEPDEWQRKVLKWITTSIGNEQGKNLILNCARQSGKSTISAKAAHYVAETRAESLTILISPSQRQSSELFKKVKESMAETPNPPELSEDNLLSCQFKTNGSRILALPGSEKTIRGFSGADLIIEDEAARVADELYMAIRPMLAVSKGKLILMSTPFGKRGHFYEAWDKGGDAWERIKVTAEENPRISKEFLEEERKAMGKWWFMQEYMCEFLDPIDSVFSYDTIMAALSEDIQPLFNFGD